MADELIISKRMRRNNVPGGDLENLDELVMEYKNFSCNEIDFKDHLVRHLVEVLGVDVERPTCEAL